MTERLDYIKDPHVRHAADRLLDGATTKGWVPSKIVSSEPAQLVKQGGSSAAWKDFGQFIHRSGGTRSDVKVRTRGNTTTYTYTAPEGTTVALYDSRSATRTNELLIRLPASLKQNTSGKDLQIKIRYD